MKIEPLANDKINKVLPKMMSFDSFHLMRRLRNTLKPLLIIAALLNYNYVQAQTVTVVTENSFPFQFDAAGEIVGPAARLVTKILEDANIQYDHIVMPWARALKFSQEKPNTLIYSIARTREREKSFKWVGYLTQLDYFLVALATSDIGTNLTINDLKELKIGVIRNSANHRLLSAKGLHNLILLNSPQQTINLLHRGRIDLFPTDYNTFQLSCLHLMIDCQQIKPVYKITKTSVALYMAFGLQTEDELVEKVKQSYRNVVKFTNLQSNSQ